MRLGCSPSLLQSYITVLSHVTLLYILARYADAKRFHNRGHVRVYENRISVAPSNDPTTVAPVQDLKYEEWGAWSRCTRACIQKRHRRCKDTAHCPHKFQKQERSCYKPRGRCKISKHRNKTTKRIEDVVYDLLYYDWSEWSACTRACKTRRYRTCALRRWCKNTVLLEEKRCYVPGTDCEKKYLLNEEEGGSTVIESDIDPQSEERPSKGKKHNKKKPSPLARPTGEPIEWDRQRCGLRNTSSRSLRIVGGREARRGSWPWQVAILTRWREQYCGGVLIAPQWVLTAAHCVRRKGRRRRLLVRVGEYDLIKTEGTEQDFRIAHDFVHRDFNITTIDSDIAVLKLRTPVIATGNINYACLPEEEYTLPENTLCYAVGWGKMKDTHLFGADVLREARVPLVDRRKCQDAFEYEITENQLCAGYRRGGVDTCAGDSGGPLMCQHTVEGIPRWHVYGVTSFGEGCGDKGKYGIYTKVGNFADWINKVMKEY